LEEKNRNFADSSEQLSFAEFRCCLYALGIVLLSDLKEFTSKFEKKY